MRKTLRKYTITIIPAKRIFTHPGHHWLNFLLSPTDSNIKSIKEMCHMKFQSEYYKGKIISDINNLSTTSTIYWFINN